MKFKEGDRAYFNFIGDWSDGHYEGHYCLPSTYYPFMPIKIVQLPDHYLQDRDYVVNLGYRGSRWSLSEDCIEKEFSFDKFLIALIEFKNHRKRSVIGSTQIRILVDAINMDNR